MFSKFLDRSDFRSLIKFWNRLEGLEYLLIPLVGVTLQAADEDLLLYPKDFPTLPQELSISQGAQNRDICYGVLFSDSAGGTARVTAPDPRYPVKLGTSYCHLLEMALTATWGRTLGAAAQDNIGCLDTRDPECGFLPPRYRYIPYGGMGCWMKGV